MAFHPAVVHLCSHPGTEVACGAGIANSHYFMQPTAEHCARCGVRHRSVFCEMNPDELDELSGSRRCRAYEKGDALYVAGDRPSGLFCVSDGKVKITRLAQDGREQILRLARPGDILAYRAMLSGDLHTNSAVAMEPVSVCLFSREAFLSLAERSLRLSTQLLSLLSTELHEAEEQIFSMAHRSVRERLVEALLVLAETYGFEADGRTLAVRLSRAELAGMIGAVPESVIRLISRLKTEGLLGTTGRSIQIPSRERLLDTAGLPE